MVVFFVGLIVPFMLFHTLLPIDRSIGLLFICILSETEYSCVKPSRAFHLACSNISTDPSIHPKWSVPAVYLDRIEED
jgi:hypothetical protein